MNDRKLELHHFEPNSRFHSDLVHQMNRAELSEQGHARVMNAMRAAVENAAKKNSLQYGVGGNHIDEMRHFLDTHYEGRHDLLPKEKEFIASHLEHHYGAEREAA